MATGDGWTSRLLAGLAQYLTDHGVGVWRPTGPAYGAGETGISVRAILDTPDRLITLAAYPVDAPAGVADATEGVQVRMRAGLDPREVDDLADQVYELLDSATGLTLGGIAVVQIHRNSYAPMGADTAGRWERADNYYLDLMRPTVWRTD